MEETPKKCKDIIKTFRSMLTDAQFAHFGDDPKVCIFAACFAVYLPLRVASKYWICKSVLDVFSKFFPG